MNHQTEIEVLQKELSEVEAAISPLQKRKSEIKQGILELRSPFNAGDIIQWRGKRGRVVAVREWCCGEPMWAVVRIKNDGTEGSVCLVRSYDNPIKKT